MSSFTHAHRIRLLMHIGFHHMKSPGQFVIVPATMSLNHIEKIDRVKEREKVAATRTTGSMILSLIRGGH